MIKNSGKIKTDLEIITIAKNGFLNTGKIKAQKFKHYGDNFENAKNAKIHVQNESLFYLSQNFINSGAINTKNLLVQSESGTLVNSGIIKAATSNFIGNKFENKNSGAIHIQNKSLFTLNENFVNSGEIYSSGLEVLSKTGKTTNSGTIISATGASFDSYLEFINTGNIDASFSPLEITSRTQGLVNSGKIAAPKITISTKLDIKNNNLIQGNLLEITSTHGGLTNSGKITASNITITTKLDIKNNNLIEANLLDITSTHGGLSNSGTIKSSGAANITIENDFSNEGGVIDTGQDLTLIARGALINDEASKIISKGKITLDINGKITNKGNIEAANSISAVTKGILENSGKIISTTAGATLDAYLELVNTGNITASSAPLQLTSRTQGLINSGEISAAKITITTDLDIKNSNLIQTYLLDITSTHGGLSNSGTIKSSGEANITIEKNFSNEGGVIDTGQDITLIARGALINDEASKIISKGKITLDINGKITNKGLIEAVTSISAVTKGILENSGKIISTTGGASLDAYLGLVNTGKIDSSTSELEIISKTQGLINSGEISAAKITITTNQDIKNSKLIQANLLEITSTHGSLTNSGTITSFGTSNITIENDFSNVGGTIDAAQGLTLIAGGALLNDKDSKIISNGEILLGGDRKIINKGLIEAAKSISAVTNGILDNSNDILSELGKIKIDGQSIRNFGKINAKKSIILTAKENIENIDSGLIKSESDITITSAEGYIRNTNSDPDRFSKSGIIAAGKTVIKSLLGFENIKAHIESKGPLEILTKGSFLNDSGNIISSDLITLKIDGDIQNLNGGALQGTKGLTIRGYDGTSSAKSFLNKGFITSGFEDEDNSTIILGAIDILTKETIENLGTIQATSDITLQSNEGEIQNHNILLTKLGQIAVKSKGNFTNTGAITSSKGISVQSLDGSIANSGVILSDDGAIDLTAKTKIEHTSGTIKTKGNITLNAQTQGLTINGDIISTDAKLIINSFDDIISKGLLQAKSDVIIKATDGIFYNNAGNILSGDGIVDITALSIKNDSTDDKNGYLQGNKLRLIATSGDIENKGVLYSTIGGEVRAKRSVINNKNIELGNGAIITAIDKDVINTGLILSTKALTISAADKITNSGDINVPELTLKTAKLFENKPSGAGVAASTKITLENIKNIDNSGIIDFGTMDATRGISSVKNSGTFKGNTLSITAPTFDNTGRTELSGGANLDVTSFTSNILTAAGISNITINGNYINTGKLDINNSDLTITANSITNKSGGIIKARNFTANAQNGGTFSNEGTIFGKNNLTVSAFKIINATASAVSAYLVSGGTLVLKDGEVTNYGGISSAQNMTINGKLENRGNTRTQKTLNITGAVTNYNTIAGKDKVEISGNLTNSNKIVSQSNITVKGGSTIYNYGTMTSYGSMDLSSSTLTNTNLLQAVGTLTATQTGEIYNSSSIYGGTVNLKTTGGSITNTARIIAKSSMTLDASQDIINQNQISLTGSGDLVLTAGRDIRNDREYDITWVNDNNRSSFTPVDQSIDLFKYEEDELPRDDEGRLRKFEKEIYHHKILYHDKVTKLSEQVPLITSGGNIKLKANKTQISLTSSGFSNIGGNITAVRDININAASINNHDIDIMSREYITPKEVYRQYTKKRVGRKHKWRRMVNSTSYNSPYFQAKDILVPAPSLIKAGGTISGSIAGGASFSDAITKNSRESGGSKSDIYAPSGGGISSGSDNYSQVANEPQSPGASGAAYVQNRSAAGARAFEVSGPKGSKFAPKEVKTRQTLAQISYERSKAVDTTRNAPIPTPSAPITMDDTTLSSLAVDIADSYAPPPMPTAPEITWEFDDPEIAEAVGEDFTTSESPGNYFVKETSPVFTDPGAYFSTENFINRIDGFEPKKQAVNSQQPNNLHFGDSMKQMDFVRRQMVNLTGLAFLEDHIDYAQEIKNLYEKGIKYGKDMKLSAGVSLSQDQVDALQDDMVWAEEIELRGTKVVIPRLYLAKSKRDKKASGLLARNIDIDAGSIVNNGSSIVGENVNLKAHSGDIINKNGGDIYGSNYLGLYASRDIKNVGSSIASGGSMLMSAGRNIENITESQRYGDAKNHITTVSKKATIKAKGPLALFSGNDLLNKGSSIESGDLEFTVHGNMINDSIEDSYSSEILFSNGHRKERSVVYKPATISSSGSTKGFIAGNFALIGSRMSSAGDSEINVGGKSMLISQVNSKMLDTHSEYTTSGIVSDKDHVESHQSLKETLAESGLTAGGKNVLINDGEQVLEGAKVQGDSGVVLKGSKTSVLAARLRNMQSDYEYHEDTFTNSTDADGHDNTTHEHSKIISNGEITIDSDSIEADYTRKLKKDSGGFFTSFSDTGLSGANKPAWAKQVEASGKTIKWNPLEDSSKSWSVHQEVLNQEFTALVSLAAAVGTMWAGGFGVFATGGATAGGAAGTTAVVTNASMMSTIGTSMGQSALVGVASRGSVSMINNGFDLGKVAGDLTSKESLKGLGLNMMTAGLTAGIGHGLGLESIAPGMDMIDRTKILAQQGLISGAVRTGLAGATGDNVGQTWKDEVLSMGLALTQSKIGDIAQDSALKTGAIGKVALHAGAGTAYSLATNSNALSGAIGGATSELVAGVMESGSGVNGPPSDASLTKEQTQLFEQEIHNDLIPKVKAVSKLTSAAVTLAIGGNAKDISIASGVAESSITYNFGPHPSFNPEIEQQKQELLVEAGEVIKEHPDEFLTAVDIITFAHPLAKAGELAVTGGIRGIKGVAQWAGTKGTAKLAEKTTSSAGKSVVFKGSNITPTSKGEIVSKVGGVGKTGKTGRQKNFVDKPDPKAEGTPHTTINVDKSGKVRNYATFKTNPKNPSGLDLVKRVDVTGKGHRNSITGKEVPTPHVSGRDAGKKIPGKIRPARPDEIPKWVKNEK